MAQAPPAATFHVKHESTGMSAGDLVAVFHVKHASYGTRSRAWFNPTRDSAERVRTLQLGKRKTRETGVLKQPSGYA